MTKYLTVADVVRMFPQISRQTVSLHCRNGKFPGAYHQDGVWMIPADTGFPPAWKHGEKGRVANARYGAENES